MEKEMRMTCGGNCDNQHWVHILVRIAVAIIIFWCGAQFGELKAMVRNNVNGGHMMGSYNTQVRAMPNMMYTYSTATAPAPTVAPTTTTAPAKK